MLSETGRTFCICKANGNIFLFPGVNSARLCPLLPNRIHDMAKNKNFIYFDLAESAELFKNENPIIARFAEESSTSEEFEDRLACLSDEISHSEIGLPAPTRSALNRINEMLFASGKKMTDLSTGKEVILQTFDCLWKILRGIPVPEATSDFMADLCQLFRQLRGETCPPPSKEEVINYTRRWQNGSDKSVIAIREENKKRIIQLLIEKIEHRHNSASRFIFEPGITYDQKRQKVEEWWHDFRFHLAFAVRSPKELNKFLGNSLSPEIMERLAKAKKKEMPFFVTPYYLSLLNPTGKGYNDTTIRNYVLYSEELVEAYGSIRAWEKEDIVVAGEPNAAGWLLPEGRNIHRRYPEVAILIPDSMGRACGGLCAPCQRMYDFQNKRLNFEFEALKPKETWRKKLNGLMQYFENDTQLRDILITGGDALMSQNKTLRNILDAVYKMALRKKEANRFRKEGERYAEIQRVRLGSRLLAYLPFRINDELTAILKEFKEKASEAGIRQFIIQTHFESPLEITPEAHKAIRAILSAGWIITNQLVFTVAASRRGHTARLRQALNKEGIITYYTFSVKGFEENYALFTPNSRSLQEKEEEKKYGIMTEAQEQELYNALYSSQKPFVFLPEFMKREQLPFISTDRNVLNLPAIGKSMTFKTIGITPQGQRILKFDHDKSRKHSPIIHKMEEVVIVENKAIAAYLRQLEKMGEKADNYASVWEYDKGETEPRFGIYEYPEYGFRITDKISNIGISRK